MKADGLDLCVYCMNSLGKGEICPKCRKDQKDYKKKPRHLLPGTKLAGRYILGSVIGEGSFGITYVGFDVILRQRLAIKEFYPVDLVNRDFLRGTEGRLYVYSKEGLEEYKKRLNKFYIEAQNLSRFSELDGICSVRDFFRANGTAYLVMGYVDGISLKRLVEEQGPIGEKRVLQMMKPVMEALSEIHKNGIIHRDISPDNLILDRHGKLILIDFGSARVDTSKMMHTMTVVFKQGFSPLEQYRNNTKQGPYSDIYALSATMYYMLFGTPPDSAVERMISDKLPKYMEKKGAGLSMRLKNGLEKGLAVEKEKRYQTIESMMSDLYLNVMEEKTDRRHTAFSKKRIIFPAVSAFVLVLILSGMLLFQRNQKETGEQLHAGSGSVNVLQAAALKEKEKEAVKKESEPAGKNEKKDTSKKTEEFGKTEKVKKTEAPDETKEPEHVKNTVEREKKTVVPERTAQKRTAGTTGQEERAVHNRRVSYTPKPNVQKKTSSAKKTKSTPRPAKKDDFAGIIE